MSCLIYIQTHYNYLFLFSDIKILIYSNNIYAVMYMYLYLCISMTS